MSKALELLQFVEGNGHLLSPARLAEHMSPGYQRYAHIRLIDDAISQAVMAGGARLVLSMPPRHGKSWYCSRSLPAWYLALYPERNVILASYEATFASTWGRQVRNFFQDNGPTLGVALAQDSLASDRWSTVQGGGMFTTGIGGPITGRGAQLIVIDDPVKNWEEARSETIRQAHIDWFNSTLYTRCEPGASIVVLMTRWHEQDLAGYLLSEHSDNWKEIRFPAIAEAGDALGRKKGEALCPERYDIDALKKIQRSLGPNMFASLYQQRPVPLEGDIFKHSMFEFCDISPEFASSLDYTFVTVDTAYSDKQSNDYTCATAWGVHKDQLFIIDVLHQRMKAADVEAPLIDFIARNAVTRFRGAYIEPKGHGLYLNQVLPRKGVLLPAEDVIQEFYKDRKHDKVVRANNAVPYLSTRKILINSRIHDKQKLLDEVLGFPKAKHDDFSDTVIDGIKYAASQINSGISICDVLD